MDLGEHHIRRKMAAVARQTISFSVGFRSKVVRKKVVTGWMRR